MKLINKISRYFLFSSILVFIFISVCLYIVIENAVTDETDEQLLNISKKVIFELKKGKAVGFSPFVEIIPLDQAAESIEFKDILIKSNESDDDDEPFRQLTSSTNVNGKLYKVIVRISLIEKEDMLVSILTVVLASFLLFFFVLYFVNKKVSKNILKDFYDTLKKLEGFSIKSDKELLLSNTKIEEFKQLNKSVLFLSEKAKNEYRSLKEFSEELNHEIQTPLAVIKSKLEILLQSSNLNEDNLSLLDSAIRNLGRFERINKSILLLNKLEHKDLFESVKLNLKDELKIILDEHSDAIASKNLSVNFLQVSDTIVTANQSLMNILLSNLISNSIKHNIHNGRIDISLNGLELIISNTGHIPKVSTDKFFERFYKESVSNESVGLGLTIVKKICELYKISVRNYFPADMHTIILEFRDSH